MDTTLFTFANGNLRQTVLTCCIASRKTHCLLILSSEIFLLADIILLVINNEETHLLNNTNLQLYKRKELNSNQPKIEHHFHSNEKH